MLYFHEHLVLGEKPMLSLRLSRCLLFLFLVSAFVLPKLARGAFAQSGRGGPIDRRHFYVALILCVPLTFPTVRLADVRARAARARP